MGETQTGTDNDMVLVHVALLPLTVAAAVLLCRNLDAAAVRGRFRPGTPVRSISVVLMLLGLGLAGMWLFYSLRFAFTGAPPGEPFVVAVLLVALVVMAVDTRRDTR
ncbi:hypothetical protein ACFOWZ_04675 [Lentzea rhizosphaerae]|uniref:Uncharacterized protein n=1 Tax=Lentzea rhizosphaerae TaxID=2041025 RepID=A0ABV8BNN4_9PSEU